MLGRQNISCPITMAMALSMAVHELVSDDHLRKVNHTVLIVGNFGEGLFVNLAKCYFKTHH